MLAAASREKVRATWPEASASEMDDGLDEPCTVPMEIGTPFDKSPTGALPIRSDLLDHRRIGGHVALGHCASSSMSAVMGFPLDGLLGNDNLDHVRLALGDRILGYGELHGRKCQRTDRDRSARTAEPRELAAAFLGRHDFCRRVFLLLATERGKSLFLDLLASRGSMGSLSFLLNMVFLSGAASACLIAYGSGTHESSASPLFIASFSASEISEAMLSVV